MAVQKLFAQIVWEDVEQNKTKRTLEVPQHESAVIAAIKANATYFTTYTAAAPDDAAADKQPRAYIASGEAVLQTAADVIRYLEETKATPHLCAFGAPILPRMFGRVSRNSTLQAQFTAAANRAGDTEKFDALLTLLRQDAADQPYLTPNSAGFIRVEKCDEIYGGNGKRLYPPRPR